MNTVPPACFRDPQTPWRAALTWLQCPPDWAALVVYLGAFAVFAAVAYRLQRSAVDADALVAVGVNAWALIWTVGLGWTAVYALGLGGRAAVAAAALGAAGFLATRGWAATQVAAAIQNA